MFFKAAGGFDHHWIDKRGDVLSNAEVAFIINKAFDLRKDIYYVTFAMDMAGRGAKIA